MKCACVSLRVCKPRESRNSIHSKFVESHRPHAEMLFRCFMTLRRPSHLPPFRSVSEYNTGEERFGLIRLRSRSLLKVSGRDSVKFLQGLLTNDLVTMKGKAMYSAILNASGRQMFDVIVYRLDGESDFLVESDSCLRAELEATLTRYRLRSKVDITAAEPYLSVYTLLGGASITSWEIGHQPCVLLSTEDPRLGALGRRLIIQEDSWPERDAESEDAYRLARYRLGVCEGGSEIPKGSALPLEYNLALLGGVSFSKGCYLGQELTARTHHVGVIRKRIAPVTLVLSDTSTPVGSLSAGVAITDGDGKKLGEVRGYLEGHGVALVRLEAFRKMQELYSTTDDGRQVLVRPQIPSWWPETVVAPILNQ